MTEQRPTYATQKDIALEPRKLPCMFCDDAYAAGQAGYPAARLDCHCADCEAAYNDGARDRLAGTK
jgi:hypothetical protein